MTNNDILNPEWISENFSLRVWPTNDFCADAIALQEGLHFFGNTGATTDGPNEPLTCTDVSGDGQVPADIWYRYTSSCDGRATFDLCDSDYDTKFAVYPGPQCPATEGALACNDDACNAQSWLEIPVALGAEYLIRIGGYRSNQGTGRMLLTCMNDCNGNLVSDAQELDAGTATDCNLNQRPDACDLTGDFDADGRLTLNDYSAWLGCLAGPCALTSCPAPYYAQPCCLMADFDSDGDVDLRDMREWFQLVPTD